MAKYHVSRISQISTIPTVKPKKDNRHQTRTPSVVSVSAVTSPVVTNTTGGETPRLSSSAACDADMFCLSGTGDLSGWQHWQNGWASRRVTNWLWRQRLSPGDCWCTRTAVCTTQHAARKRYFLNFCSVSTWTTSRLVVFCEDWLQGS